MRQITIDRLIGLLAPHEPPCISLYQPTHRHHPENQQDPIRFRNLVKAIETALGQKYPRRETRPLLAPFHALAEDRAFWNHACDGLAVLGSPMQMSWSSGNRLTLSNAAGSIALARLP